MSSVGIIANPSSGKDIRRIVAQGWVVSNQEKIAITRRLLCGLAEAGVHTVYFMPEPRGICMEAYNSLPKNNLQVATVDIPILARQEDSTQAAQAMLQAGVGCIITLGGDGTNRAVFKGSREVPLLPISTGTNNVFPEFHEGTLAGYAAGLLATGKIRRETACWRSKILLVRRNGQPVDLALVDLAVATDNVIGARAIWEVSHLRELFLTRAQPWSIGLSAIGGALAYLPAESSEGLHLVFGEGADASTQKIRAAIGPGLFTDVFIRRHRRIELNEELKLHFERPATLAFDGERDLTAQPGDDLTVSLSASGPWVLDVPRALVHAN
jgi:predicted polyphosphate/ATP-dependent NAD kinase